MILQANLAVSDYDVAGDVADKLRGREGRIKMELCRMLAEKLYDSAVVTYTQHKDMYSETLRVSARVIVGQEHEVTHTLEPFDFPVRFR